MKSWLLPFNITNKTVTSFFVPLGHHTSFLLMVIIWLFIYNGPYENMIALLWELYGPCVAYFIVEQPPLMFSILKRRGFSRSNPTHSTGESSLFVPMPLLWDFMKQLVTRGKFDTSRNILLLFWVFFFFAFLVHLPNTVYNPITCTVRHNPTNPFICYYLFSPPKRSVF